LGLTWSKCKTQGTTSGSDLPFLGEKSSSIGVRVDRDPYPNRRHLSIFPWNSVATREPKKKQKHNFSPWSNLHPDCPWFIIIFLLNIAFCFLGGYTPFLDTSKHGIGQYIYISYPIESHQYQHYVCIYIYVFSPWENITIIISRIISQILSSYAQNSELDFPKSVSTTYNSTNLFHLAVQWTILSYNFHAYGPCLWSCAIHHCS
jgi:hypothetical protein